ncbi:MAG TPA: serine hydrolase domain-containing protein [Chitinophagaceae bacterium]
MKYIFLLLFVPLFSAAQKNSSDDIDRYITDIMKKDSIPAVTFVVAKDGKPLKQSAYGFSNLEHKIPASVDTRYEIASVSKPFTATAVMILVEQGKLALDSPIGKYLPDVPQSHYNITARQLLSHTAGLPTDHYDPMKLYGPSILRYSVKAQLKDLFSKGTVAAPGAKFQYSNAGFFVLAAIIESISGQTYREFLRTNIYEKADLRNSCFVNADSIVDKRAQGYTIRNGRLVRFSLEQSIQAMDAPGFASIISSAEDLVKWSMAITNGKIIKTETLNQMKTPSLLQDGKVAGQPNGSDIGLGWFVRKINGRECILHFGATGTAMMFFPKEKLTMVFLTNLAEGYPRPFANDRGFHVGQVCFPLAEMVVKKYL